MAKKKHRKLFPLLSETNKTFDCSTGLCDPACPYNCYPYPYYFTASPPSQPPQPPLSAPSPSIRAIDQRFPSHPISSDAVIIISVASAVLAVLLTGFVLAAKFASNRVNRSRNQAGYFTDHRETEGFGGDNDGEEQVDHPIWFIRTTGLQQSVINAITICKYRRGDGLIERTDCPVCLSEFEEHESLRLLPKCNHAFHISCIDTWLRSHTNCPLCRASVVSSGGSSGSGSVVHGNSGSQRESNGDGDGDGGEGRDGNRSENRAETGESRNETALKDPMSSSCGDSVNTDLNSDAQMEISRLCNQSDQQILQERFGDKPKEEQVRVIKESLDPNLGNSINGVSNTITQMENSDFPGKSCQETSRNSELEHNIKGETETEDKPLGEQASCSSGNVSHQIQSQRMSDSMDSGEPKDVAIEDAEKSHSGISSNTSKAIIGNSCFSRNTSSVFPL